MAGLVVSAVNDVCTAATSSTCTSAAWPLYIPVLGPFLQLGYLNGNSLTTVRTLLVMDGLLQGGGLAMLIAGAVARQATAVPMSGGRAQLSPYPLVGGAGLALVGRF
jgi:hypothetical protein